MHDQNRHEYAPHLHEREVVQKVTYQPMICSAFGRVHPKTQALLNTLAVQPCVITAWRCATFAMPSMLRCAKRAVPSLNETGVSAALLAEGWSKLRHIEFFKGNAYAPCMETANASWEGAATAGVGERAPRVANQSIYGGEQ